MASIKKYNGSTFVDAAIRKYSTASEIITPPTTIYADGSSITTCTIKGNTVQNGTPTPEAPVDVVGCGVRTGQLFEDKIASCSIDGSGRLIVNQDFDMYLAKVEQGETYTASAQITGGFFATKPVIGSTSYNGQRMAFAVPTITAPITGYMTFRVKSGSAAPMLNTGSTALPYEPYGYKLPLTVNGTEYPIYLGQVETTRRIKKLVFDGTEEWGRNTSTSTYYINTPCLGGNGKLTALSSHYAGIENVSTFANMLDKSICERANGEQIWIRDTDISSVNNFKGYLASEYTNGTPVTVWYVLATEETGIVNEPIRKIGDYADTVSGITIPTITGADSFDVETTLKPSEVSLSYTGWHDASVQEWDGSQWDE